MKTFLLATLLSACVFTTVHAQNATATDAKTMTKAEKDAAKAKKEADLVEAFTKAGLTADEQSKSRAVLDASNDQTKPIKADASLSDDDRKEKLDAIYKERNDKLKVIMGNDKYKLFKATQKAQKEAAAAN